MSSNLCPNCHTPNKPQARFCASCGQQMPSQPLAPPSSGGINCPSCQVPLRAGARFCPSCGFNLTGPISQLPPAQAPGSPRTTVMEAGETLVIRLPGGQTQRHMLPPNQPVTIGRKQGNLIVVNFPGVSGNHMRLDSSAGAMTVTDLNSTNGTELNGRRIAPNTPHPLAAGDIIRVGDGLGNSIRMSLEGTGPPKLRTLPLGMMALAQATTVTIGRDPNSTLPLNHPGVSQRHAMVERQNGALFIRDLGSTNGTFVNGQRLAGRVQLSPGDEIQIGPFKLVYDAAQQSFAQAVRLGHRLDAVGLGLQVAKGRMILNNISVCIQPGEFVSLVGGSGAGKSTLLKSMNGYSPANHGQMLLDGEELYPRLDMYRAQMGYVPQDDIIHRELTVDRALYYSAKLRLPDASPAEIQERIMDALKMVDMTEHVHKRVRVLSGGQRKRVSIAAELLAKPTLFFLDEPTSGLDPGLEKRMMADLNRLSDEGRTVVLVTHATANIDQCDHVAFLAYGRLAYFGPPHEALKFFNVRDFADIYLRLSTMVDPNQGKQPEPELQGYYQAYRMQASHPGIAGQPGMPDASGRMSAGHLWADHFQQSPTYQKYVASRQSQIGASRPSAVSMPGVGAIAPQVAASRGKSRDSMFRQMVILARRQFDLIKNDLRTLFILLAMMPLIGVLFMSVNESDAWVGRPGSFEQIRDDMQAELEGQPEGSSQTYTPAATAQTLSTMLGLALTQSGTFAAIFEIVKERGIYKRERAVNLRVGAYVFSKVVILSLFAVVQVASVLLILSLKIDMGFDGAVFESGVIELFVTILISVIASIMFGLFISAIVPSSDVVPYALLGQLFIQIVLSGTLFPLESEIASKFTVANWSMDAMGSTIDLEGVNQKSVSCSVQEVPSPVDGSVSNEVICGDQGDAAIDLSLDYEHTDEHLFTMWGGLAGHALLWGMLTVVMQARKKTD